MNRDSPFLSIVIPTYNDAASLDKLLRSIDGSRYTDRETIVVDDGSTDGTLEMLADFPVRLVRTPRNGGPGRARNLGAAEAKGEVVLFLDSDVIVEPESLGEVARFFRDHPARAAMIGVYAPEPANAGAWPLYKALQCYSYYRGFPELKEVSLLWSAVAAFRRERFRESGGFHSDFTRPSMEDLELGRRISKDTPIWLNRRVVVRHHFPATLKKNVADHFDRGRLWVRIWFRYRRFDNYLSTPRRAAGRIAASAALLLVAGGIFRPALLPLAAAALLVYLICNHDLWAVVGKRSPRYLPAAFGIDLLLGVVLGAAAIRAVGEEAVDLVRRWVRRPKKFLEPLAPEPEEELSPSRSTGSPADRG